MSDVKDSKSNGTTQVRFGGVGGQGIVLAGRLLGTAAALFDGKHAVCTQSYGPEARGGASRTDVVISDEPVHYPFVTEADVLVALFQEAYMMFRPAVKPSGTMIVDSGLVRAPEEDQRVFEVPATAMAQELGTKMAANVVMFGCLVGKSEVVSRDAAEQAIRSMLKPSIVDMNLRALEAGINLAQGKESP